MIMGIEAIAGLVVVILGAIAGAFGIGHARGTSKAEAKAAERRAEVTKGASDVQEDVKRMGDDYVDRELRERFTRPSSR